MPIRCTCPTCNRTLKVADSRANQVANCPSCKQAFTVPGLQYSDSIGAALVATAPLPSRQASPVIQNPAVSLRCPHCQSLQAFAMDLAGQVVRCAVCNLPLQVPMPQGQTGGNIAVTIQTPQASSSERPQDSFEFGNSPMITLPPRRRRGNGVVALVFGLISFVVGPIFGTVAIILDRMSIFMVRQSLGWAVFVLGLAILSFLGGLIFGIIAISTGSNALHDDSSDGCAKGGAILGWLSTGCVLIAFLLFCGLLLFVFLAASQMR